MKRWIQRLLVLAGIGVIAWAILRKLEAEEPAPSTGPAAWPPLQMSEASSAATAPSGGASTDPADGSCPASHPIKGKRSSGIYHVPGGRFYERTRADRCYADAAAAEADGLRAAKR